MKTKLLSLTVVGVFLFSAVAFAASPKEKTLSADRSDQYRVLTPAQGEVSVQQINQKKAKNGLEVIPFKAPQESNDLMLRSSNSASTLWTLDHTDGVAEFYLGSGAAGDTFVVVFTPAAPCSVKYVESSWYTPGNYTAFAAKYSEAAKAISPDGEAGTIARGDFDGSPIGELLAPYTLGNVPDYGMYQRMPDDIGNFQVGSDTEFTTEPFVIGFVKGGETPQPLADGDQAPITYTWFGGPWTDGAWGRYSDAVDVSMAVYVTYPWGAPIAFTVNQLPNTFNTSGPFTARFRLFDDVDGDGTAITGDDVITFYATDGADTVEVDQASFTEYDVETSGNGWYEADISGLDFSVGNEISYWVDATDNQDLYSVSDPKSFTVKQPSNPDADLLVIMDGGVDRSSVYFDVLDENGIVYETWNADPGAENGIDASVINYGWNNIILFGWGAGTIPATDEEDPGYATFLDGGGNLFYTDQDYFYAHGLPATGNFSPGDFAYDYFGLGSYTNDPEDADSVFTGIGGVASTISEYSLEGGFTVWDIAGNNWSDPVDAGNGTGIFLGSNDSRNYGVQNTTGGGGTAIYLGFMAEANVDTTAEGAIVPGATFTDLMNAVLGEFGVASPPQITNVVGNTSATYGDGPWTVSADIVDYNGDAITATLKYTVDGGTTWNDVAMTDGGSGTFSGDIPAQTAETYVSYYVHAEDAGGLVSTNPDANTSAFWFWKGTADNDVLFVDDMAGYFGYFGPHWNEVLPADADMYSVPNYGMPDATVFNTSAHTTIIWAGDYAGSGSLNAGSADNALKGFLDGGGNLFFASDEWAGTYYGWPGFVTLEAGHFAYDYLGVELLESDGSEIAYVEGLSGNALTDGIPRDSLVIPLGQANYTDRTVPVGEYDGTNYTAYTGVFNNSGTYKTVFVPFIFGAIDSTNRQTLLDNAMTWFADGSAATGATGLFAPEESDTYTGVKDVAGNQPTEFSLDQNYPNPFNPTTNISFAVPKDGHVTLTVYNMLGQKVATLVNEYKTAGKYTVNWTAANNGAKLASGVYFYSLQAEEYNQVKKMVLMK